MTSVNEISTGVAASAVERGTCNKINDIIKEIMYEQMMNRYLEINKKHIAESTDALRNELMNVICTNEKSSTKQYANTQQYIQELKAQTQFNRNMILAFIVVSVAHIIFSVIGVL